MFKGLRLSARTFFFVSLAVCFFPLFWSACFQNIINVRLQTLRLNEVSSVMENVRQTTRDPEEGKSNFFLDL